MSMEHEPITSHHHQVTPYPVMCLALVFMSHRCKSFNVYKRLISLKYWSQICLSQHFSAEINQPPHRFGIWRCCMVITQVCLKLPTIKGHFKMYSFITQHRCFEGACRSAHKSCCLWSECSVLYQPASLLQLTWNPTAHNLPIQHLYL